MRRLPASSLSIAILSAAFLLAPVVKYVERLRLGQ